MNNKTLPQHIRAVADQMFALAKRMTKEGGTAAVHAPELAGAANIARTWADGIEGGDEFQRGGQHAPALRRATNRGEETRV